MVAYWSRVRFIVCSKNVRLRSTRRGRLRIADCGLNPGTEDSRSNLPASRSHTDVLYAVGSLSPMCGSCTPVGLSHKVLVRPAAIDDSRCRSLHICTPARLVGSVTSSRVASAVLYRRIRQAKGSKKRRIFSVQLPTIRFNRSWETSMLDRLTGETGAFVLRGRLRGRRSE
jgi:hypothetical protein